MPDPPHTPRPTTPPPVAASHDEASTSDTMVRQLSAIMFTDMVGYTALMQIDEREARHQRDRQRAVLEDEVSRHGGRILQFYGDGTLSVFRSAIEAVHCALHVQEALVQEPRVPLRVGIHTGDIVHDRNGVFGDGVNVAARIQGLAAPASILVSGKVYDELKNQSDLETRSLGRFEFKNVKRPMEVHAVVAPFLTVPDEADLVAGRVRESRSVAVLPFVNMSADPDNEFFSDGITEEIINALTRVPGLQVTARTSSFAFKNHHDDVRTIASRLGVGTVLEGSVRRAGNRVRIAAQLIDARDGYHLFSEVYDRGLDDIFQTQDEISSTIVTRLQAHFSPSTPTPAPAAAPAPVSTPRHDTEAYTEYLKGRYHWNRWTPRDALQAIDHLERSAEMDPTCALPYSALAGAYTFMGSIGHIPAADAYPRAAAFARQALELDPDGGGGHLAIAAVRFFYDWDFRGAEQSFLRALERTPGSAEAHHIYALFLKAVGRLDESVAEMEAAVRLDPLSLPLNQTLGVALFAADRVDDAERQFQQCLDLDPRFRSAVEMMGWVHFRRGDLEAAAAAWERLPELAANRFAGAALRGLAYARSGDIARAQDMLELLHERRIEEPSVNLRMDFAVLYYGLGDLDETFRQLARAVEERLGTVVFLATSPNWSEVRGDPRFQALVRRVGIPVRAEAHA